MKKGLFTILAAGLLAGGAIAGQIDLQNAADGSAKIDITTYGNVNLVWIGGATDTIPVSFINAFLDADNDIGEVSNVTGGQGGWTYDRSAFKLPAELSLTGGNEYGLVSGDSDGSSTLPLGSATHIIDTLEVHNVDGVDGASTLVTFELGARQPQVFGAPPTYTPYTVAPGPFPPGFPNFTYVGDGSSTNTPFEINWIPEPASLGLLALGGLVAIRRRR
jgi:hypothetical protein